MTPIIGITLDSEEGSKEAYAPLPWYALRKNYSDAIIACGGVPLHLPHEPSVVAEYAGIVDGLLLTGGDFDIPPSFYGDDSQHEKTITKGSRTDFEMAITREMLRLQKPILGICAGEQLLNVVLGGTLIQHIPDEIPNALEHEQTNPRTEPGHSITIHEGTLLHKVVNTTAMEVNSSHHQAVGKTGEDVIVNAVAPDGVIEGIEYTKHPFCLGVEWHPEYQISEQDTAILKSLIDAA